MPRCRRPSAATARLAPSSPCAASARGTRRGRSGPATRAAGAILVGKTNTCELGLRPVTEPVRYGPTLNPRSPHLMSGGSSGGSAAAVAAELVPFCDGSDAGGSIRIPSACCGVVGMRPSRGLVPSSAELDGVGISMVSTFGPVARTVRDAALLLDVMAGTDRLAAVAAPGRLPVRLALTAPLGVPIDEEPRAAAVRAANALAALGHDVPEGTPDWDDESFPRAWMTAGGGGFREVVRLLERLHGRPLDPSALEPATRGCSSTCRRSPIPCSTTPSRTCARTATGSSPTGRRTACSSRRP